MAGTAFGVLHLSVALRRRVPEVAFVMASLVMLAVVLVPDSRITGTATGSTVPVPLLFMPSSLVFLVLVYAVASRSVGRRVRPAALLIALAGAVLAGVRAATAARWVYPGGWLLLGYLAAGLAGLCAAVLRGDRGGQRRGAAVLMLAGLSAVLWGVFTFDAWTFAGYGPVLIATGMITQLAGEQSR